ncbi:hypothetical protein THAOC_28995 [Thalassiosira oceanica]|uniref:Uncharacterized protein n=1 Tax=Thalassiosira oceanica TaxID=159749 RepID=K0RSA2_THAOC|nr:hypothetical protein THAOC_28995 [Thalassiosira oceanica]|eukprot:EJK51801.1 hypothetical protein THAOC_28995 [Thalassiosira oceanica]
MRAAKATRVMRQFDALEKIIKKADAPGGCNSTRRTTARSGRRGRTRYRPPGRRSRGSAIRPRRERGPEPRHADDRVRDLHGPVGHPVRGVHRRRRAPAPEAPRSVNRDTVAKPPGWMALFTR